MGVDCNIVLPHNVQVQYVAKVIAKLAGAPSRMVPLGSSHPNSKYVKIDGLKVEGVVEVPELNRISVSLPDGTLSVQYHQEVSARWAGCKLMLPRSTAFWLAMGRRLIEFFGGGLVYSDHDFDGKTFNETVPPKSNDENGPEDGDPWQSLQDRVHAIQPLTRAEIRAMRRYAAYEDEDEDEVNGLPESESSGKVLPAPPGKSLPARI